MAAHTIKPTKGDPQKRRPPLALVLNLVPILRIGVRADADVARNRAANVDGAAGAVVIRTFVLADAVGGRTGAATFGGRDAGHAASDGYGAAAAGAFSVIRSGACTYTRTSIIRYICPRVFFHNIIGTISAIATSGCYLSASDADIAALVMFIIYYETASYAGSSKTASGIHNTSRNTDVTT